MITLLMLNKTQLVLRWWQHDLFFILPLINYISKHLIFIQKENICFTHLAWTMVQTSAKHFMCKCMVFKFFTQLSAPQKGKDYWIFSWALFTQTIFKIQINSGGEVFQYEMIANWNLSLMKEFDTSSEPTPKHLSKHQEFGWNFCLWKKPWHLIFALLLCWNRRKERFVGEKIQLLITSDCNQQYSWEMVSTQGQWKM